MTLIYVSFASYLHKYKKSGRKKVEKNNEERGRERNKIETKRVTDGERKEWQKDENLKRK